MSELPVESSTQSTEKDIISCYKYMVHLFKNVNTS